ncbi:carboxylesterase family protein [Gaetbulibacter saemankumensis]|uniref:carboxylesterase family protein n=1 Tax=Gaetbulibacter saemankumensis TaxID=311208 RepID=UPI0004874B0C|nr:alpha/beta hydrolase-fold protein [Gaetbulibacter saemankumensis]
MVTHLRIGIICFVTMIMAQSVFAQQKELYSKEIFVNGSDTLKYRMLLPKDFSEDKEYSLLIFLHGSGERGSDNEKQLTHGSRLFTNEINRGAFPAIVIFPQCPQDSYWSNVTVNRNTKPFSLEFPFNASPTKAMQLVISLLDYQMSESYVNKGKIYLGGLSMGGMGTFELLSRKPDTFAAAFAICGGGNPELAANYATTTDMWIFHGAKDDVVDPQLSINMVSAIIKNGGKPNFNLYADDNHNSWDSAFAEPQLLPWIFSKTKDEI